MKTIGSRVLVTKVEEVKKEGFETVDTQDNFVYKGKVEQIGVHIGAQTSQTELILNVGDTILFAKYSPDTHEIEHDGVKYKFVATSDILAVL